jgi:hypothetical protein
MLDGRWTLTRMSQSPGVSRRGLDDSDRPERETRVLADRFPQPELEFQ